MIVFRYHGRVQVYRMIDEQEVADVLFDVFDAGGHRQTDATQIATRVRGNQWIANASYHMSQSTKYFIEFTSR